MRMLLSKQGNASARSAVRPRRTQLDASKIMRPLSTCLKLCPNRASRKSNGLAKSVHFGGRQCSIKFSLKLVEAGAEVGAEDLVAALHDRVHQTGERLQVGLFGIQLLHLLLNAVLNLSTLQHQCSLRFEIFFLSATARCHPQHHDVISKLELTHNFLSSSSLGLVSKVIRVSQHKGAGSSHRRRRVHRWHRSAQYEGERRDGNHGEHRDVSEGGVQRQDNAGR
mmetsp:Transcript_19246/g.37419  ORF Transcript_19246/g.37419 Transcript_19246/m.37419 type:complete len:224 (+) Transcript_19246:354-1025(+)